MGNQRKGYCATKIYTHGITKYDMEIFHVSTGCMYLKLGIPPLQKARKNRTSCGKIIV